MQYEGPEEVYENIEDNFVDVANCGEKCLDTKRPIEEILDKKKNEDFLKDFEEEDKLPECPEILNEKDFKRVMHEYIAHMEKKEKKEKKALNSKKTGKKAIDEEEEEEEEEEYEEEEEILDNYLKKPDLKPENVDKIKVEDMFTRRVYDKIDIKDDVCLQAHMAHMLKDSSDEEVEEKEDTIRLDDEPTIEETSKNESGIAPKLNIIKETNLGKNSKKMKRRKNNEEINETNKKNNEKTNEKNDSKNDAKNEEKSLKNENNEKNVEKNDVKKEEKIVEKEENLVKNEENLVKNEENLVKKEENFVKNEEKAQNDEENSAKNDDKIEHKEIFRKREKGETAEEKAERKAGIKAFKQDRKEKKQKFKEEFKYQHVRELKKTSHSQNIGHVSVYKL